VLTVMVIIAILAVMLLEGSTQMLARAERANCAANLRSLYVGASGYIQDQGHWPQIPVADTHSPEYALAWIAALKGYGISGKSWICPSIQRALKNPNYNDPSHARVDYFPTPFDARSYSPYRWSTHPWFMERGNMHGDGQLIIFANSELKSAQEATKMHGSIDPETW
jgi:type II secretory pathway pseudopilin PulG